jgi:hypothetical protein
MQLDSVTEEGPQEVHPCQPLLSKRLKDIACGMQLVEDSPGHLVPLGRQGDGAATGEHGE